MYGAGEVFRSFESALDECLVNDNLCSHVRQFTFLPRFHLLSHWLKVSLHSIDPDGDAVDERERLRVFRQYRRKISSERHVRAHEHAIATGHRQTHALVVGVPQTDGETAPCHLGFEVENPKGFHAVWRDRVLVVDDTDVAKPERLDQGLHDLMVRDRAVRFVAAGVGTSANSSRPMVRPITDERT